MKCLPALIRVALTVVVAAGASILAASPAHAATTATLVRLPTAPSAAGYGLDITIAYDTNAPTTAWRLEFDLPPTTVPSPWSGLPFSRTGDHWTLNYQSTAPQRAGTTLYLSLTMFGTTDPANCRINGNACTYIVQTDTQPPTTPSALTATRYSGQSPWGPYATIYLTWTGSTDNYRLSGYEIAADGQVVATPGVGASYLHVAYTTARVTYTVRAFDSVGNYSAAAAITLPAL